MENNQKVWYITGASKGLGLALVKQLIAQGQKVAATSRDLATLKEAVGPLPGFLALQADLRSDTSVAASLRETKETFGVIDVIVNNAGYGTGGALEELEQQEIVQNFEINLFSVIRVIQQAMQYLRQQRSGHIINIASIAGFAPGIGWSVYAAAKAAVIGLSDALAKDLQPLGIKVTAVAPGAFRTDFIKPHSVAFAKKQISDYDNIRASHKIQRNGRCAGG
jgi:NAD(P)-dependent dehydrogenase (short-subunit alcohol dehydrogenase family)